jgi:hypothetical protein
MLRMSSSGLNQTLIITDQKDKEIFDDRRIVFETERPNKTYLKADGDDADLDLSTFLRCLVSAFSILNEVKVDPTCVAMLNFNKRTPFGNLGSHSVTSLPDLSLDLILNL